MPPQPRTSYHGIKDKVIDLLASLWPIIGFVGAAIWVLILGLAVNYVYDCFTKDNCPTFSNPHT